MSADGNNKSINAKIKPKIAITNQQPDIVVWSKSTRGVVMIELAVPWDERMTKANERKRKQVPRAAK